MFCNLYFSSSPDPTPIIDEENNLSSSTVTNEEKNMSSSTVTDEKTALLSIEMKTVDKEVQVNTLESTFLSKRSIMDLIRNNDDLVALTGIPSMDKLLKLVSVGELIIKSLNYNVHFSLDILHRILLVLMKLKHNTSYKCLAVFFGVSKSTCTNYFYETIDFVIFNFKTFSFLAFQI